ncbi:MAG TPA: M28 family peptidase [Kineosporiaceae bacterium]|nr:M28 family peptidase [Kineosporiaceae bacterium]
MAGFEAAEVAVAGFEDCADVTRVTADVAALAGSPRGSGHHPGEMAMTQEYVAAGLGQAGWRVTRAPFERRWVIGVTDAGGRQLLPRRVFRRLSGVNLLAELPGAPAGRGVLIVAHLDSVACSPGADDNASGVAALLECARLLAGLPQAPPVRLAVVDLEELACVGSRVLAGERDFVEDLELVVALEAVGTFLDAPGTQRLGGLGLMFPGLARRVRANQSRGDFLLAVHRASSARAAQCLVGAAAGLRTPLPVLTARDPRADGWKGRAATLALPWLANLDRSDHSPFWRRGVPAMMVTTTAPFRNRHYHREGDRPETLDYPRLTAVATAVAAMAATWSVPLSVSPRSAEE